MCDAPAPAQQVERELDRLEGGIPADVLEVRSALQGGLLEPLHHRLPLHLVVDQGRREMAGAALQRVHQGDRVLHGQLGPRADGEVSRVGRVAQEHDVPVMPRVASQRDEPHPQRSVRQQGVPPEILGEEVLAEGDAVRFTGLVQARRSPGGLGTLHDERAGGRVERIRVDLEQAVLALPEDERERVEHEVRSEPDVLRAVQVLARPDGLLMQPASQAVHAVRADHQVGRRQLGDLFEESGLHAELGTSILEDPQELFASQPGEGVPS